MTLTEDEILHMFKETEALLEGHFILTSGAHSPIYFQSAKVLQYPNYAQLLCGDIAGHFVKQRVDVVVAPAVGGIVVGYEVARALNARSLFAERVDGKMALRRGFEISEDENVIVVEDVVTTGGSVREVIDLVHTANANLMGVGAIVHRGDADPQFGVAFRSLLQMPVKKYPPDDCPLCREGKHPPEKPGSRTLPRPDLA